jgi:hypothetical protein
VKDTLRHTSNDYDSIVSSNYGARSNPKFVKEKRKSSITNTKESSSKIATSGPGPGSYETNSVILLKKEPMATIGNTLRGFGTRESTIVPGPDQYNKHQEMTKRRVSSAERNAPRATIGREGMALQRRKSATNVDSLVQMYNHASMKSIGDSSSVKVPFAMAPRPISAQQTSRVQFIPGPGPQDYRVVDTKTYLKRSRVIPNMKFTTAGKELESKIRQEERAKSPGPTNYRPKSECFLKRSPSATIGNTKRVLLVPRTAGPGPSDYNIPRSIGNGPKYHIAKRYLKLL